MLESSCRAMRNTAKTALKALNAMFWAFQCSGLLRVREVVLLCRYLLHSTQFLRGWNSCWQATLGRAWGWQKIKIIWGQTVSTCLLFILAHRLFCCMSVICFDLRMKGGATLYLVMTISNKWKPESNIQRHYYCRSPPYLRQNVEIPMNINTSGPAILLFCLQLSAGCWMNCGLWIYFIYQSDSKPKGHK